MHRKDAERATMCHPIPGDLFFDRPDGFLFGIRLRRRLRTGGDVLDLSGWLPRRGSRYADGNCSRTPAHCLGSTGFARQRGALSFLGATSVSAQQQSGSYRVQPKQLQWHRAWAGCCPHQSDGRQVSVFRGPNGLNVNQILMSFAHGLAATARAARQITFVAAPLPTQEAPCTPPSLTTAKRSGLGCPQRSAEKCERTRSAHRIRVAQPHPYRIGPALKQRQGFSEGSGTVTAPLHSIQRG